MHRLNQHQLLRYKKRLEADNKAYGRILQTYQRSQNGPLSETVAALNQQSDRYFKRILLRQVARVCEYETVVKRLEEFQ